MHQEKATASYKGIYLITWNYGIAVTFFVLAVVLLVGWQTPAICYQLTSVFGAIFLMHGLLGTTAYGASKFWLVSSYLLGMLLILFALPSLTTQLALGQRGNLVGFTYYSICGAMLLLTFIGVFYIYVNWQAQTKHST